MKRPSRSFALAAVAVLATSALAGMGTSSAQALPAAWVPSVGSTPIVPGQQFDVSGTLALSGTFNGNFTHFTCVFQPGDITLTAPNPVPTAGPGGTISLPITLPTTLSSAANPRCTDDLTGSVDDVTTNGVNWTVNVTAPSGTSPSPYTGVLSGSVDIPAGALTIENPLFYPGCAIVGPDANDNVTGDYDTSTGEISADVPHALAATVTGPCTLEDDTALDQADLTLDPILTAVYQ